MSRIPSPALRLLPGYISVGFLSLFALSACSGSSRAQEQIWFAIEQDGRTFGYTVIETAVGDPEADRPTVRTTESSMRLTLLGQSVDIRTLERREFDSVTGRLKWIEGSLRASGGTRAGATLEINGSTATHTSLPDGTVKTFEIPEDMDLSEEGEFATLFELDEIGDQHTFKELDPFQGLIMEVVYSLAGREEIVIGERRYDCRVFEARNLTTGAVSRVWAEVGLNYPVRSADVTGMVSTISDPTVRRRIEEGDFDAMLFADVDLYTEEYRRLTSMTIRARIRSAGEVITPESLNVPGQRFEGTVTDNVIEGIFEIESRVFEGTGRLPFPIDYSDDPELQAWLGPSLMIEADDPRLIAAAEEIIGETDDCWEAVQRLARWVGTEIGGSVPGASARQTFDRGSGECGSHSRLFAAFCRAVGIPCRLAIGGAYTPLKDGSFGQHVWNEVWMGEAGWISLDTTFQEFDYIDAGHLRLGEMTGFFPEEMEVLEHRLGPPR